MHFEVRLCIYVNHRYWQKWIIINQIINHIRPKKIHGIPVTRPHLAKIDDPKIFSAFAKKSFAFFKNLQSKHPSSFKTVLYSLCKCNIQSFIEHRPCYARLCVCLSNQAAQNQLSSCPNFGHMFCYAIWQ